MRRILQFAVLATLLLAGPAYGAGHDRSSWSKGALVQAPAPKLDPSIHFKALTRAQATAKAQVVQDGQCGRGSSWLCNLKRFPESICLQGNGYWYCNGGVQQVSIWPWGGTRTCNIYTHVQSGVARLVDNGCF